MREKESEKLRSSMLFYLARVIVGEKLVKVRQREYRRGWRRGGGGEEGNKKMERRVKITYRK